MGFQRAYRRHQHHRVRENAAHPALDVHELLRAEVSAEACFGHDVIRQAHRRRRRNHGVAAVGDIRERAAVHQAGRAVNGLHEVGLKRVAQERRHCACRVQITRRNGLAAVRPRDLQAG